MIFLSKSFGNKETRLLFLDLVLSLKKYFFFVCEWCAFIQIFFLFLHNFETFSQHKQAQELGDKFRIGSVEILRALYGQVDRANGVGHVAKI